MIYKRPVYFLLLLELFAKFLYAQDPKLDQNYTCETAAPFCTGTQYSFPAGVNAGVGQTGPDYNCLLDVPNPAWYYMRVDNPGNLVLQLQSVPPRDIDFCCWGPFSSEDCCDQLTAGKVVSCAYGGSSTKICNIPASLSGQYYMLVVTNTQNLPTNIIFDQTGGTGSTDCSLLPPPCSNNSPICAGQPLQLNAAPVLSATYHWTGPAGYSSGSQNPTIYNAQLVNAGDYYLHLTINGQPEPDSIKTTAYIYKPLPDAGPDTIIEVGTSTALHVTVTQGSGSYQYHWEPVALLVNPDVATPATVILNATTVFTVTVTDDSAGCTGQDMVGVFMQNGVLSVNAIALPATVCAGQDTQLQALGSGGSGDYTYAWSGPSGFSSSIQSPTVHPVVTSAYTVIINDGFNTDTSTVTVNVNELPVANAGVNQSIQYGTYTFLNGSVAAGNQNCFYTWSPASRLINANVKHPQTTNLTATTVYSLAVTDMTTNCVSNNQANVSVEVTGGPLNANPVATPSKVCKGDTTQLHASAGGGNVGYYQYTWSSNPPGFASTLAEPLVCPDVTTTYTVVVNDGFNSASGSTKVTLYPQPVINLGPMDTTVCIYSTYTLDAGNPGCNYLWSNGASSRIIKVEGAGLIPETQNYNVKVTNGSGCYAISYISITFSYSACTGTETRMLKDHVRIYPNPSGGVIHVENTGIQGKIFVSVTDLWGKTISDALLDGCVAGSTTQMIDLSGYSRGIYFIRFMCDQGAWTEKLIVE